MTHTVLWATSMMHAVRSPLFVWQASLSEGTLRDARGSPLYIGAAGADAVMAALAPWRTVHVLHLNHAEAADVILPGGNMALVAIALEQWGPPP